MEGVGEWGYGAMVKEERGCGREGEVGNER